MAGINRSTPESYVDAGRRSGDERGHGSRSMATVDAIVVGQFGDDNEFRRRYKPGGEAPSLLTDQPDQSFTDEIED